GAGFVLFAAPPPGRSFPGDAPEARALGEAPLVAPVVEKRAEALLLASIELWQASGPAHRGVSRRSPVSSWTRLSIGRPGLLIHPPAPDRHGQPIGDALNAMTTSASRFLGAISPMPGTIHGWRSASPEGHRAPAVRRLLVLLVAGLTALAGQGCT